MLTLNRFASPVEAFHVSDPVDPDVGNRPDDDPARVVTAGLVPCVTSASPATSFDV